MQTRNSLLVALTMLVAFGAVALWVRQGLRFAVAAPTQKLSDFPKSIEGWEGVEAELQDGTERILKAADILSLRFERAAEPPVFVHATTWTDPDHVRNACPHSPTICYPATGWSMQERESLEVEVDRIGKVPVQAIVMQRGDQRLVVAFNYRIGDNVYTDEKTAHAMHLKYFGQPVWPAVTKLMIQIQSPDIASAKPNIERFVKAFYRWYQP